MTRKAQSARAELDALLAKSEHAVDDMKLLAGMHEALAAVIDSVGLADLEAKKSRCSESHEQLKAIQFGTPSGGHWSSGFVGADADDLVRHAKDNLSPGVSWDAFEGMLSSAEQTLAIYNTACTIFKQELCEDYAQWDGVFLQAKATFVEHGLLDTLATLAGRPLKLRRSFRDAKEKASDQQWLKISEPLKSIVEKACEQERKRPFSSIAGHA